MDQRLKDFLSQLLRTALNSAIASLFWKMPWTWTVAAIIVLLGVVIVFKLY